jgi:peptidoglycan/LPS O-acetylase OafA/YrhL
MHRLPGLDLLRAIAIIWVMLFHSFLVGGLGPDFEWLSRYGWMGVDIFFVLSGFLIGSQLLRQLKEGGGLRLGEFYARRAWRILPAYAVVLAAYVMFPVLREAPGLEDAWQFASFTLNLFIDYGRDQAFSHAWSLCVEEHFYLFFPLLAWGLSRRVSIAGVLGLGAALLALGVLLRGATWLHWEALDASRSWFVERMYYPTWMRLDGLLVGVLLAALRVYRPEGWVRLLQRSNGLLLLGLAVFALALLLFRERTGLLANTLGWPVLSLGIGLLVLAGASRSSLIGRWPLPGVAWLATISYSLYLSHKIAFHLVESQLLPLLPLSGGLAQFAVYALASLLLGAGLHYLVERPFLHWRDARRRAALAPAAQLV